MDLIQRGICHSAHMISDFCHLGSHTSNIDSQTDFYLITKIAKKKL